MTGQTMFNVFLEEWLEEVKLEHARSTYVKYSQLTGKHIRPFFDGIALEEIDRKKLLEFRESLRGMLDANGEARTEKTIHSVLMTTNRILKAAFRGGIIREEVAISTGFRRRRGIVHVFTVEEQRRLEEHMREHWCSTALAIYVCLYTGLRLGELCALRWEDINLGSGYIQVCATVQRLSFCEEGRTKRSELVIAPPKSNSSVRRVPMPSFLVEILREEAVRQETEEKTEKHGGGKKEVTIQHRDFFLQGKGNRPVEPRTLQYRYSRYIREAGVPPLTFHALRHTFATRCITAGIDPKTLSEILGHADIKVTMDYYFYSSFEFKKGQIEKLSGCIAKE